jgi:hypothetical protein
MLGNETTGEVRVVYRVKGRNCLRPSLGVVIKLFKDGSDLEGYGKIFLKWEDYEAMKSHWNTKERSFDSDLLVQASGYLFKILEAVNALYE